jgi:broad specificity phosphatase PhoE
MPTIVLARHGETDWNRQRRFQGRADPPLNDAGREQATALGDLLAGEPVAAIYSSPLRRALETAAILGERFGLPIETLDGLLEIDTGSWTGLTRGEVEQRFPQAYGRWIDHGPGWEDGESYEQVEERVAATLDQLSRRHPDDVVLAVTHSAPIRSVQARAAGIRAGEARRRFGALENCALVRVAVEDGSMRRID